MRQAPEGERDASPAWERIGHDTAAEAYAHMRAVLLENKLRLDVQFSDWSGCRAPLEDGTLCDVPTKAGAEILPMYFVEPLCPDHLTRATVEAMRRGPGDWSGSW